MSETGMSKFDPSIFINATREKIKTELLGVIPPEMWDEMIKKELQSFLQGTSAVRDRFDRVEVPAQAAELHKLIREEIKQQAAVLVKEYLQSPEWHGAWKDGKQQATEAIKQIAIEAGPTILTNMMVGMIQSTVQLAIQSLINNNPGMRF
jgi:hypothetical protein